MKTKATIYNILAGYSNIIFSIISGLVLVPFYLDDFGAEVYGVWLATGNLVSWLGIMGGALSIVFAQNAAVAYSKSNTLEFRELVGSGIILFGLLAIFIYAGVLLLSDQFLSMFTFNSINFEIIKTALNISALAACISVFQSLLMYILGAWFVNEPVLHATIIGGVVGIVVNILLLYLGFGLLSIPLSMLCKSGVIFLLLYRSVHIEWLKRQLDQPLIRFSITKELGVRSGPILLSNIASIGLNHSQSTVIGLLLGPTAATIVSLTDKLYAVVKTFIYPIGNSFLQPLSSIVHKEEEFESMSKKFINNLDLISLLGILICYTANKAFISLWVGPEYFGGPWLSAALAFSAFLIIRVNLIVAILNAKGAFKVTSLYTVVDLSIRIVTFVGLFFLFALKNVAILPLAECAGIILGTRLILSREIPAGIEKKLYVYVFFLVLIILGFLKLSFETYSLGIDIVSGLLMGAFILFIIYEVIRQKIVRLVLDQVVARFR